MINKSIQHSSDSKTDLLLSSGEYRVFQRQRNVFRSAAYTIGIPNELRKLTNCMIYSIRETIAGTMQIGLLQMFVMQMAFRNDTGTNFKENGSALERKLPETQRSQQTPESIEAIRASDARSPARSTRKHSSIRSKPNIRPLKLQSDLKFHPCKIQVVQELKSLDYKARRQFYKMIIERINRDPNFINNLIMADEAPFHLNGYINKQNCRHERTSTDFTTRHSVGRSDTLRVLKCPDHLHMHVNDETSRHRECQQIASSGSEQ
ncbi:hypothetical protein Trydic_g1879 [Trypoxylus dichotomus]